MSSDDAHPTLAARMLRLMIFLGIQAVVLLILLEVGARLIDPAGISYYPKTAAYMDTMILEEPIGYRNQPNLEGEFWAQPVTTNSLGLRNREIEAAPNPGVFRIMLAGDSILFGPGVADDETLPVQLERMLRERIGQIDGRPIEVVNMGTISYNTEQELIQYKQLGHKLKPDLIVLRFARNDIEPKMWIFSKRSSPLVDLGQRSYAISAIFKIRSELRSRFAGKQLVQIDSFAADNPRWQAIDSSMTEYARLAREAGAPFIVVIESHNGTAAELVSGVGAREGFPVVAGSVLDDPRWSHMTPAELHAPASGGHLGGEGLGYAATVIFDHLQDLGLIPADAGEPSAPGH